MYKLTLTHSERRAFDWIGNRYASGEVGDILLSECLPEDLELCEWDGDYDITFLIPEHVAWEIRDKANQDAEGGHSRWPCFSPELCTKLELFLEEIV